MLLARAYQKLTEWALPLAVVAATLGVLTFGAENVHRMPPDGESLSGVLVPVEQRSFALETPANDAFLKASKELQEEASKEGMNITKTLEGPTVLSPDHPDELQLDHAEKHVAEYIARSYRISNEKAKLITQWALEIGKAKDLDPLLILAIVAVESSFNPTARSGAGAEGLMQVMTNVHVDKFRAFGGPSAALQAYPNMVVGSDILSGLIRRTGSVGKALKWYSGAANHASDYGYGAKVLKERSRMIEAASGHPDRAVKLLKEKRQGATYTASVKEKKLPYDAWMTLRKARGLRVVTPSDRTVEEPSV